MSGASSFTILDAGAAVSVPCAVANGRVRLAAEAVEAALGWEVGEDGLCRDAMCVPFRTAPGPDGSIDLADLAAALGRPLALDAEERAAYLGAPVDERRGALAALEAPDFALPNLSGRVHRLSDQRGRKVLLVAYASW